MDKNVIEQDWVSASRTGGIPHLQSRLDLHSLVIPVKNTFSQYNFIVFIINNKGVKTSRVTKKVQNICIHISFQGTAFLSS